MLARRCTALMMLAGALLSCRAETNALPYVAPTPTPTPTDEPPSGPAAPIMDGEFSEWGNATRLAWDRPRDAEGAFEVNELHATSRGSELFVHFDTTSLLNLSSGDEEDGTIVLSVGLPDGRSLRLDFRERDIRLDGSGSISGYDIGYIASPTHAGRAFEMKLDLSSLSVGPGDEVTLRLDGSDSVGPVSFKLSEDAAPTISRSPQRSPETEVRLASLNTMLAGFLDPSRRDRLTRLLGAAAADVYVLQELGSTHSNIIASRLAEATPNDDAPWNVIVQNAGDIIGNAVASRSEIIPIPTLTPRFTAGVVLLDEPGPVAVFSVHLKCCGYVGSDADNTRLSEGRKIRRTIQKLRNGELNDKLLPYSEVPILIAGDFNDVGSPALQEIVSRPRDSQDGLQRLRLAHLSGPHVFTWYQSSATFPPGILDLVFHSRELTPTSGFVIDTRHLDPWGLDALMLQPNDSNASDHLLLVADFATAP